MSTYCAADWHGCKWICDAVLDYIKPDDTLYFLGDCADRNPDGWEIMKALLTDPRVIYIKGNHDDFFLKTFYNYKPNHELGFYDDDNLWCWFSNGGHITYDAFNNDPDCANKYDIIQKMKNIPFLTVYHNTQGQDVLLSHAGFNPEDKERLTEEDFIWDRYHFIAPNHWAGAANQIVVHGHTPIPLLIERQQEFMSFRDEKYAFPPDDIIGAYWYAQRHKVCIDCGSVWTEVSVLLNLDTWEEIIITPEGIKTNENE